MQSSESVTEWLQQLKQGESLAAERLWQRYLGQLVRLAHKRLGDAPRRAVDEHDVVIAAFADFCKGVEARRFTRLDDRDDLWQVLVVLTQRRAIDQRRREGARRPVDAALLGESALQGGEEAGSRPPGLAQIIDSEPTPEFAALAAEEFERLLDVLQDDTLRRIALDKMEGYTNQEIAKHLGTSLRGVERKLQLIRRTWEKEEQG